MSINDASRIVIDYSRMALQIVSSITDDSRGIIYNHNVFIVQVCECLGPGGGGLFSLS
jgi:hypothetical protein